MSVSAPFRVLRVAPPVDNPHIGSKTDVDGTPGMCRAPAGNHAFRSAFVAYFVITQTVSAERLLNCFPGLSNGSPGELASLVDLERRCVVGILPDQSADTVDAGYKPIRVLKSSAEIAMASMPTGRHGAHQSNPSSRPLSPVAEPTCDAGVLDDPPACRLADRDNL